MEFIGLILMMATVLTNLGEKMSDEEVDELLKAVDTSSGEINYTGMLHRLIVRHAFVLGQANSSRPRPHHPGQLNDTRYRYPPDVPDDFCYDANLLPAVPELKA